jgi:hypothetical protein
MKTDAGQGIVSAQEAVNLASRRPIIGSRSLWKILKGLGEWWLPVA